jgi:L-ascorbate metabolism protein UlaG (beta-lactamase superfamily)
VRSLPADRIDAKMIGVEVTIVGHASVVVTTSNGTAVLVDPVFTDRIAGGAIGFHPAKVVDRELLPPLDAIIVTHHHVDHWHAPTIAAFPPDVPIVVPPDEWLLDRLRQLGREEVRTVQPWDELAIGELELQITPSDVEFAEFGIVFGHGGGRYWHMSDTNVGPADAERIRSHGAVDLVAARYLPVNALLSYARGVGWQHDERDEVARWLEAACAVEPRMVFPYFGDIAYAPEHAWANGYAAVYSPSMVADLLGRRLPAATASVVRPGDVFRLRERTDDVPHDGDIELERGASPFVQPASSEPPRWRPVDRSTLAGVDPTDEEELRVRLEKWFVEVFGPWLGASFADRDNPLQGLLTLGIVWQLEVELSRGRQLHYHCDFGSGSGTLEGGRREDATYAAFVSGRALLAILRGEAGAELLYLAGGWRGAERVLLADPTGVRPPPVRGWDLFEHVPEPFLWCMRQTDGAAPRP